MQTIILVLKTPVTVKELIASYTEKLLFINDSPILLRPPGKNLCTQLPSPLEIAYFWTPPPPPLEISVARRGGKGVGIFSGTTH